MSFLCLLSTFLKINLGSLSCILGLYSQHSRFQHMGPWIFNFHYFGVLRFPGPHIFASGGGAYTYTHRDGTLVVVVRSCGVVISGVAVAVAVVYSCLSISSRAFCFFSFFLDLF